MRAPNMIAAVIMLLLAVLLQGCGRKGPLYLQQIPAAPAQPAQQIQPAQSAVMQAPTVQNPATQNPTDATKQP